MRLVEQHRIDRHDPRFAAIDVAAFASKNLYNTALYVTRQAFIHHSQVIPYEELAREMKTSSEYRALPAKVAQWVVRQVTLAWKSYFAACAAWEEDPSRFLGHPKLPKYLDKHGRNLLTYTEQAISRAPPQSRVRCAVGAGYSCRDPADGHRPGADRAARFPLHPGGHL